MDRLSDSYRLIKRNGRMAKITNVQRSLTSLGPLSSMVPRIVRNGWQEWPR
jgi:hypothetical protein